MKLGNSCQIVSKKINSLELNTILKDVTSSLIAFVKLEYAFERLPKQDKIQKKRDEIQNKLGKIQNDLQSLTNKPADPKKKLDITAFSLKCKLHSTKKQLRYLEEELQELKALEKELSDWLARIPQS